MRVCHKYMTHPHFFLLDADSSAGYQPMLASKSVEYDRKTVKLQIQVLHHINYLKHVKSRILFFAYLCIHK